MLKNKAQTIIKKCFQHEHFSKIIIYKNPSECNKLFLERVNPNHVGYIYGQRKKSSKGQNRIRIAKVFFSTIPVSLGLVVIGWFDAFTNYAYNLIITTGIFTMLSVTLILPFIYWYTILKAVSNGQKIKKSTC